MLAFVYNKAKRRRKDQDDLIEKQEKMFIVLDINGSHHVQN